MTRTLLNVALSAAFALGATAGYADSYPEKPIRVVTARAGGGSDFTLRLLTPGLTRNLGQQFVVDNRGATAPDIVSKATPDGYTLLFSGATVWIQPFLRDSVPYDPVKDFTPITMATRTANVLVVNPKVPAKTVEELMALAKAKPGKLNYATSGYGNSVHLAGELFKYMTGLDVVRVNYKGASTALTDLLGGRVQYMFGVPGSVMPHVEAGRLRALAITTPKPSPLMPDMPVVASAVPGFESGSYLSFFAPAGTPSKIINLLHREIVKVLNSPEVTARLKDIGVEAIGNTPAELDAFMKADMAKMGKVLKKASVKY